MLCLVLAAAYGLNCLVLSILIAVAWRACGRRIGSSADGLLAARLLPPAGAALLTLSLVLPAFLIYEPTREFERPGPVILALVLLAVVAIGAGVARGWRACAVARELLRQFEGVNRRLRSAGSQFDIVDLPEPIVAVIGGWRPRIVAARSVLTVCSGKEFRQVIAHEAAHVSTRDNLKLLLMIISPDVLAWLPSGAALTARWRAAAECEADERASGSDPRKRVALASALIKIARLAGDAGRPPAALSMPVAADDVESRVRRLLLPPADAPRRSLIRGLMIVALLMPIAALPFYALVHRIIEAFVAFGL